MTASPSVLSLHNVRAFIAFRVFFNARFYYPIFSALFLDYGLTLEQFTILNVIWTITIVLAEVPSGAMADLVGRRALVRLAAVLMLIEMLVLLVVPVNSGWLLFSAFAINRVASGLAEAAASGADEALAYDSLAEKGWAERWPEVLEILARFSSAAFFVAMITGGLIYDPGVVTRVAQFFGSEATFDQMDVLRWPIALTFGTSLLTVIAASLMVEPASNAPRQKVSRASLIESFRQIGKAGLWTLNHRFVLFTILGGLIIDSVARQYVILGAQYYRIIQVPEAYFGFLGASMAVLSFVLAKVARLMAQHRSPVFNLGVLALVLLTGLMGVSQAVPYWGVLFGLMVSCMMFFVSFFQSHYLNREVDASMRATVLSFKGLALNLGLGVASILHTVLLWGLRLADPAKSEDTLLIDSLFWFPAYFLALLCLLFWAGSKFIRQPERCFQPG